MIPVLVVDDEKFVREGIVQGTDWKSVGCEVVGQAKNGEEALALARTLHPVLIVTDIRMPKMDGIELVRTLREEKLDVKVIFLTAYSDFSYAQQAVRLQASDYLLKPFEDGQLEAVVKKILGEAILHGQHTASPKDAELLPLKDADPEMDRYVQSAIDTSQITIVRMPSASRASPKRSAYPRGISAVSLRGTPDRASTAISPAIGCGQRCASSGMCAIRSMRSARWSATTTSPTSPVPLKN